MTEIQNYHQWSIAAVRFSTTPDGVADDQRERLDADVERAITLESAILGSPEALGVSIPLDQVEVAAEQWMKAHPQCDLPETAVLNGIRRELSVQTILDRVAARATPPTKGEAKEFFAANMQKFHLPERRSVRHILVTINPDYAENTEDAAKLRVDQLMQALESGEDFGELAGKYSECPTAMQAGQVGTVSQGTLYPEVDEVAFALGAGSWGGPVRTELGWHLVACDEILAPEKPGYEAVAERIMAHLTQQAQRAAQVNWLKALTNQSAA